MSARGAPADTPVAAFQTTRTDCHFERQREISWFRYASLRALLHILALAAFATQPGPDVGGRDPGITGYKGETPASNRRAYVFFRWASERQELGGGGRRRL